MNHSRTVLLILGMHRSGTSAITRALNLLGVNLGSNLLEGRTKINARGFWENKALIETHDRLLEQTLASGWFDTRPLPDKWWKKPSVQPFKTEIREILHRDIGDLNLFAVKDPRLCRVMPLWREILEEEELDVRCILIIRHPEEVARSLCIRDGFDAGTGYSLWLRHVLEAEANTRGLRRMLICYDELLEGRWDIVQKIGEDMEIIWPERSDDAVRRVNEELAGNLRHHRVAETSGPNDNPLAAMSVEMYQRMCSSRLEDLAGFADGALSKLDREMDSVIMNPQALFDLNRRLVEKNRELNRLRRENRLLREQLGG
jgi:hypothetical protein